MTTPRQGRAYDVSGRRAQALQTRVRILDCARALFVERGYAATSIADVAAAAEVSAPTVFSGFGSKVNLLKEAAETAMVGDAKPVPMAQRPAMQAVFASTTAEELLDRYADLIADRAPEIYPIYAVIYRGRDAHAEIDAMAETLDEQRLTAAGAIADAVLARSGVDDQTRRDRARDSIWAVLSLEWYGLLVVRRGWSIEAYRDWVRGALEIGLELGSGTTSCRP